MSFTIEEVASRNQLKEFIDLPFRLYRDDSNWVPPIRFFQKELFNKKKHPFHEHGDVTLLLARNDQGSVAGRIAVIVNHTHNEYHKEKTGFFGFLESEENTGLFKLLLDEAEGRLQEAGMDSIRGPMNFSTNEECGLLVKGFNSRPLIMMPYNPRWYADVLENNGYLKVKDLLAYYLDSDKIDYSRFFRIADLVVKRHGIKIRDFCVKNIHREVPVIMDIYNECWRDNWGFVPMSKRELDMMADELKMIMLPELGPIVEIDGEPVAFAIALPDANKAFARANGSLIRALFALKVPLFRTKINQIRVLLLGVRKAFRGRGIEALLIHRIIEASSEKNMGRGEMSWILENNNSMRRILEKDLNADQYRTYRVFQKTV
ncbi:MAG: N-acetyltransferase [Candidatus Aegiribacteria sp.]|nr:N-acetyltransferase [Candidatus Aegiribacteria sp.]